MKLLKFALLIALGATTMAMDQNVLTRALAQAAQDGSVAAVERLCRDGADIHGKFVVTLVEGDTVRKVSDWTLLMIASNYGRDSLVKYLLEKGGNVNAKDSTGGTALMWAVQGRFSEKMKCDIIKCLVEGKANVNDKDNNGGTALMEAAYQGLLDIVKCLKKKDADVNAKNQYGATPLMLAANQGHLGVVKYLSENGANVSAKDKHGSTALKIAESKGHIDVVLYLKGCR